MTEKMKDETTNEIRELTQDEIAAVSGGNRCLSYVPAPVDGPAGLEAPPQGHSTTIISSGGQRIGGSAH
jgi:hypothetical protein